jgi:hypothetical protein
MVNMNTTTATKAYSSKLFNWKKGKGYGDLSALDLDYFPDSLNITSEHSGLTRFFIWDTTAPSLLDPTLDYSIREYTDKEYTRIILFNC